MPLDLRISKSLSCDGRTFSFSRAATPDGQTGRAPPLAAAKVGTLTTRTSNTVGTLTMATGHGIATGNIIDIYWSTGASYGLTVGTVAVDSVPFTTAGGTMGVSGGALPAANTAITAMVCQLETFPVTAADMYALGAYAGGVPMVARFRDSGNTNVAIITVSPGNEGYAWFSGDPSGSATPFGSNVANVLLTHGSSAGTVAPGVYAYVN